MGPKIHSIKKKRGTFVQTPLQTVTTMPPRGSTDFGLDVRRTCSVILSPSLLNTGFGAGCLKRSSDSPFNP